MRLSIFGSGYVGLVTGACMAEMGNHIVCYDIDEARIDRLNDRCGLLAGPLAVDGDRQVTLTTNRSGRFECRWVTLRVEPNCRSTWLKSVTEMIRCPVAHGEGRLAVTTDAVARGLDDRGLVAFRYVATDGESIEGGYPDNPNGSVADIAGITDASGAVVGLMPHPEDHLVGWQDPMASGGGRGLPLFEAFVAAAR